MTVSTCTCERARGCRMYATATLPHRASLTTTQHYSTVLADLTTLQSPRGHTHVTIYREGSLQTCYTFPYKYVKFKTLDLRTSTEFRSVFYKCWKYHLEFEIDSFLAEKWERKVFLFVLWCWGYLNCAESQL